MDLHYLKTLQMPVSTFTLDVQTSVQVGEGKSYAGMLDLQSQLNLDKLWMLMTQIEQNIVKKKKPLKIC